MLHISDIVIHIFNIVMLLAIIAFSVWIFLDSMKEKRSVTVSLGWALLAMLFFPPVGIIIYFCKRKIRTKGLAESS